MGQYCKDRVMANSTRQFVAILGYDEEAVAKFNKENGYENDIAPGDHFEREFGWLEHSGLSLEGWALVDNDIKWEQYIAYVVEWAICNSGPDNEGASPLSYGEWCKSNDIICEECGR